MNYEVQSAEKDLFGKGPLLTQCGCCDKVLPQKEAVVSTILIGEEVRSQEHFCSNSCASNFWLEIGM